MMRNFSMIAVLLGLVLTACSESQQNQTQAVAKTTVNSNQAQPAGAKVYESACMRCHVAQANEEGLVAPPIFAVKDHVLKTYPERTAFVNYIMQWVKAPDAAKTLMPGAVSKFGVMPAQLELSDADLQAVAEFIYDADLSKPDWYASHYQAEHGKQP